jgi:hypothetical protein
VTLKSMAAIPVCNAVTQKGTMILMWFTAQPNEWLNAAQSTFTVDMAVNVHGTAGGVLQAGLQHDQAAGCARIPTKGAKGDAVMQACAPGMAQLVQEVAEGTCCDGSEWLLCHPVLLVAPMLRGQQPAPATDRMEQPRGALLQQVRRHTGADHVAQGTGQGLGGECVNALGWWPLGPPQIPLHLGQQ